MFVYFIFGGTCKRTLRVSLDLVKCVPLVGTYVGASIDPTLWYKVLALDSILVDCDQKAVWWTCEKYDVKKNRYRSQEFDIYKVRDFFKNKEQLFRKDVELLAEVYEKSERIFHSLNPEVFDRDGNVSTYKELLRILHVFILPEVRFLQKHQHFVTENLYLIEKEYENIEMLVKMNAQSKRNYEELLGKQRRSLLTKDGVFTLLSNQSNYADIIKPLLKDTEKDIRKLDDTISILIDATDEESGNMLEDSQTEIGRIARDKERIMFFREELQNGILQSIQSSKSKGKKTQEPQTVKSEEISDRFKRYVRETSELDDLSKDIKQQINIKIRMSSVREAINLTLEEIETDGLSYGFNRQRSSLEIEADLFDPAKKSKDRITLNKHVTSFLQTNQSDLRTKHEQFCTRIKENCKAITEKAKQDVLIKNGSLTKGRVAFSVGSSSTEHKESLRFSTRWLFGSVPKEDCEILCKEILEHITDMAGEIATEIQGNKRVLRTFQTQVYICYEEHISEDLMPMLSKLYEHSFSKKCESLSAWIRNHSATELGSINKTMNTLYPDRVDTEIPNKQMPNRSARVKRSRSIVDTLFGRTNETSGNWSNSPGRTRKLLHRNRGPLIDPTPQTEQQKLNTQFTSAFKTFFSIIQEENTAVSIFSKLRHLTRAVQSAQNTFSELRNVNGQNGDIYTDDMLDILILLICRLDPQSLLKLYAHLNLVLHLSPYFLEGNINEYSLVTLTGAYQHLFECQEMYETTFKTI